MVMAILRKYGKPSRGLIEQKGAMFRDNAALLAEGARIAALYTAQPARLRCKICDAPLGASMFRKAGIGYTACPACSHLNGLHDDTAAFCDTVYAQGDGQSYALNYGSADRQAYEQRIQAIYAPKVDFLQEALKSLGESPRELRYADFGAGSGYFVAALRRAGLDGATGYEVSAAQVRLAQAMMDADAVIRHDMSETENLAATTSADVVSMIGVLEHLRNPREVMAAFRRNPSVRYIYLSVPLFSPSVSLEAAFPAVFQRHLSGGHTHLFTERSLNRMAAANGFEAVAEWWFGTDMVDLFRAVIVMLDADPDRAQLSAQWKEMIAESIDELQLVLDRRHKSSEVHMLLQRTAAE